MRGSRVWFMSLRERALLACEIGRPGRGAGASDAADFWPQRRGRSATGSPPYLLGWSRWSVAGTTPPLPSPAPLSASPTPLSARPAHALPRVVRARPSGHPSLVSPSRPLKIIPLPPCRSSRAPARLLFRLSRSPRELNCYRVIGMFYNADLPVLVGPKLPDVIFK